MEEIIIYRTHHIENDEDLLASTFLHPTLRDNYLTKSNKKKSYNYLRREYKKRKEENKIHETSSKMTEIQTNTEVEQQEMKESFSLKNTRFLQKRKKTHFFNLI